MAIFAYGKKDLITIQE